MRLAFAVLFALLVSDLICAQTPAEALSTAQKIRLLESTRQDVRKLFAGYSSDLDDEDDSDTFEDQGIEIEVWYASGMCSDDADSSDFPSMWNVKRGKAVKVEISFNEPVAIAELTLKTWDLTKESDGNSESNALFSKTTGIMFDMGENGVETIKLFPPAGKSEFLCKDNLWGKGFFSSKSWFGDFELNGITCRLKNLSANVDGLELGSTEITGTSEKTVSVVTTASDPENDVLTYRYSVSAGSIRGTGGKVVWDLTGVPPGTYTITVGVDDGGGVVGRTDTKTIVIR